MTAAFRHGGSLALADGGRISCPPVRRQKHAKPRRFRKFAEKYASPDATCELLARCLWAAFPGPSRHAVATQAAPFIGASVDTIERIMASAGACRGHLVLPILTSGFHAGVITAEELFGGQR